jgi:hypothetical protein
VVLAVAFLVVIPEGDLLLLPLLLPSPLFLPLSVPAAILSAAKDPRIASLVARLATAD